MLYVSGHEVRGSRSSTIWVRASDATSAEDFVRAEISTPGAFSPAELVPYSVVIEVADEDVAALEQALARRRQDSGLLGGLIVPGSAEGAAELYLDADADTPARARELALEDYRALRREAGLPLGEPPRVRVIAPWPFEQRRHRELLQHAEQLQEQRESGCAVVVAQTAMEVLVERTIDRRLQVREVGGLRAHIISTIRTHTMKDKPTQDLWFELTGDRITQVEVWQRYLDHLKRRHAFVHTGADVSAADAAESLAVVTAMIEHVEGLPPALT